jgi:hypothetical protein
MPLPLLVVIEIGLLARENLRTGVKKVTRWNPLHISETTYGGHTICKALVGWTSKHGLTNKAQGGSILM